MKKILLTITLFSAFILTASADSLEGEDCSDCKKGGKRMSAELRAKIIAQFDTDGDGQLSESERAEAKKAFFKKGGKFGGKRLMMRKRMMAKFDTDGDGKLDEAERAALKTAIEERRAQQPAS